MHGWFALKWRVHLQSDMCPSIQTGFYKFTPGLLIDWKGTLNICSNSTSKHCVGAKYLAASDCQFFRTPFVSFISNCYVAHTHIQCTLVACNWLQNMPLWVVGLHSAVQKWLQSISLRRKKNDLWCLDRLAPFGFITYWFVLKAVRQCVETL